MVIGFFQWWYGLGLAQAGRIIVYAAEQAADFFSLPTLIRTWFAPWKNDQLAGQNLALSDRLKIWELNIASRVIGFLLRTFIIIAAIMLLALVLLFGALALVFWLLMPFSPLLLVIVALVVAS